MLTCFPCLKTKGLIRDITHQIKDMSLKAMKVQDKEEKTQSSREGEVLEAKREEEEEWVAEAEPGVLITLVSLPNGANLLKKIRFREEMFDVWEAQRWWRENCERIMALYSVCQIPPQSDLECPIDSGGEGTQECDDEEESNTSCNSHDTKYQQKEEEKESSRKCSNGGMEEKVDEWVVEDEPGVFVTIRSLPDGSRELRRVELSRERFGEVKARVWWEENKVRLQKQYVLMNKDCM